MELGLGITGVGIRLSRSGVGIRIAKIWNKGLSELGLELGLGDMELRFKSGLGRVGVIVVGGERIGVRLKMKKHSRILKINAVDLRKIYSHVLIWK